MLQRSLVCLIALALLGKPIQAELIVQDLGLLPGGSQSVASRINNNGVVVGFADNSAGQNRAVVYSNGVLTDRLSSQANVVTAVGNGINIRGDVTGGYSTVPSGFPFTAFISSGGGIFSTLGVLTGDIASTGADINDSVSPQVVGNSFNSSFESHAFLYSGGSMQSIFGPASGYSTATAINNAGFVTGSHDGTTYLYSPGGSAVALSDLGGGDSSGENINSSGDVVGHSADLNGDYHAFLNSAGTVSDLGTLGGFASAEGINDNGQIVGYSEFDPFGDTHAFLYSNGTMTDLNSLISPASGWELQSASDINNRGQIVGFGLLNGEMHGFLLDTSSVPEPSSLALLGLGGIGLAFGAYRRRRDAVVA